MIDLSGAVSALAFDYPLALHPSSTSVLVCGAVTKSIGADMPKGTRDVEPGGRSSWPGITATLAAAHSVFRGTRSWFRAHCACFQARSPKPSSLRQSCAFSPTLSDLVLPGVHATSAALFFGSRLPINVTGAANS